MNDMPQFPKPVPTPSFPWEDPARVEKAPIFMSPYTEDPYHPDPYGGRP